MKGSLLDELLGLKSKLENIEKEVKGQNVTENTIIISTQNLEEKVEDYLNNRDQIVDLNIGGKIFKTMEKTILNHPNSLFASIIEKNKTDGTPSKELFFDRSPYYFHYILSYLRTGKVVLKKVTKQQREEITREFEFYGLSEAFTSNKKQSIDIGWDQALSKAGMCTVNTEDNRKIRVHSTTCYTHFVTNRTFTDENFIIELESTVTQTDNYYYIGIVNENYNYTSNCMCCNPANSYYVQCDGSTHINGARTDNYQAAWNGANITITLKVNLQEKNITFSILDKADLGPFSLIGNTFRVVAGHCNTGNGEITINDCYEV